MEFDTIKISSKYFNKRCRSSIELIVIHAFGCSLQAMLNVLEEYQLSVHYIIPCDTAENLYSKYSGLLPIQEIHYPKQIPIVAMVEPQHQAYHCGSSGFGSFMQQANSLNHSSIGIEFEIPGYANGDGSNLYKFSHCTTLQIITGIKLIRSLLKQYAISTKHVLAHSTIAVGRKTDPGPLFAWRALADNGIGYMPPLHTYQNTQKAHRPDPLLVYSVQTKLRDIGFLHCPQHQKLDKQTNDFIMAYVMQFAPELWGNIHDPEFMENILLSLKDFDPGAIK